MYFPNLEVTNHHLVERNWNTFVKLGLDILLTMLEL